MPMSASARQAVGLAVTLNPSMASSLHDILLEMSECVKRKPGDRFGPLAMMLTVHGRRLDQQGVEHVFLPRELEEWEGSSCATWNEEWLAERFSSEELRRAIADALNAFLAPAPADTQRIIPRPSASRIGYTDMYRGRPERRDRLE